MIKGILFTLCAVVVNWLVTLEARTFTDATGRQIEADLVAHAGEKIVLERSGKKFTVAIDAFAPPDQEFIRGWIAANPNAIDVDYKFRFYADLKITKGVGQKEGPAIDDRVKFTDNLYEMIVYNNGETEIIDVEIRYEIYVADFVVMKGERFARMAYGYSKTESLEVIAGVEKNKSIPVKGRYDFERKFSTEAYIDRDGGVTDEAALDKVIGVKIRVYKGDQLLDEYDSAADSNRMGKISWQNKAAAEQER